MTFFPVLSDRILKVLPIKFARAAGVILIIAGVFNLMIHFFPTENNHHHGHKVSKSVLTLEDK